MAERRLDYMRIAEIAEAEVNPKEHDHDGIAASVARFGYVEPMVMDERTGRLVSGHGRLASLRRAEEEGGPPPAGVEAREDGWYAPVVRGWESRSDTDAQAALVAVNRLTERGGWNPEALHAILDQLHAGPGLEGTGYEPDDLADLLDQLNATDEAGAHVENSRGERLARYTEKDARSIVLDYDADTFQRVTQLAERGRKELHVASNADLFVALLERP